MYRGLPFFTYWPANSARPPQVTTLWYSARDCFSPAESFQTRLVARPNEQTCFPPETSRSSASRVTLPMRITLFTDFIEIKGGRNTADYDQPEKRPPVGHRKQENRGWASFWLGEWVKGVLVGGRTPMTTRQRIHQYITKIGRGI